MSARTTVVALPLLITACTIVDLEGMALISSSDGVVVGDSVSLSVVARDGSRPTGPAVDWVSSDPTIATVDGEGVVTGVSPGVVGIEAWTGDYRLAVPLIVWAPAGPFTKVANGGSHGCGLHEDGTVWCWGSDGFGQLGTAARYELCFTPAGVVRCAAGAVPVDSDLRFVDLVSSFYRTCALTPAGEAHCWGYDDEVPTPVAGEHALPSFVAGGAGSVCGLDSGDALLCLDGGATPPDAPAAGLRFAEVVMGDHHTCGITTEGATLCWGRNGHGQLGVPEVDDTCGAEPCTEVPQEVESPLPFVDLALGAGFSCGLTADGTAWCWGDNERGQLGDGSRTARWQPAPVAGVHVFARLAAGDARACGMGAGGGLHCWGYDDTAFGTAAERIESDVPVPAAGVLALTQLRIVGRTQCGLDPEGSAWCWGINDVAQLGNGRQRSLGVSAHPTRVVRHPSR